MGVLYIRNENGELVAISALKGDTGDSGVYIGTDEPTDPKKNVWINPEGSAGYGLAEEDKQEIANIIKNEYEAELLEILGGDENVAE